MQTSNSCFVCCVEFFLFPIHKYQECTQFTAKLQRIYAQLYTVCGVPYLNHSTYVTNLVSFFQYKIEYNIIERENIFDGKRRNSIYNDTRIKKLHADKTLYFRNE